MKKVMVGMSGGVDSSVVAAILKESGYEVCGLTLKLLKDESKDVIQDAKSVADKLGIEHRVLDISDEFDKYVIKYFVDEYKRGLTPNPCVVCNKRVKFGLMLDFALKNGFDYIATGHYANIFYDSNKNRWLLKKSESLKDQSYFLYGLTQNQISHSLFPLGNMDKSSVRDIAEKYDLSVASKSESQDICFIDSITPAEFISSYTGTKFVHGDFEDCSGNKLGTHKGIVNYTVGQRRGLGISFREPLYVNNIDAVKNRIVLGGRESGSRHEIEVRNVNFILTDILDTQMRAFAKIRYRAKLASCTIAPMPENKVKVLFEEPIYFPAPGQSIVFYTDNGIVIGGGIII